MVVTKAKELCAYVMDVTQKSPKQFRFSYVSRLQANALGAIEKIIRANDVLIGGKWPASNAAMRYSYQRDALTNIKVLTYLAEMAMSQSCILMKQYEQIARLATDCQNLLGAWINSDRKRLSAAMSS
jgi:hypothetical protein